MWVLPVGRTRTCWGGESNPLQYFSKIGTVPAAAGY